MSKLKIKKWCLVLCFLVLVAGVLSITQSYRGLVNERKNWKEKKENLSELKDEISEIKRSIALYEKEKEDFQNILFTEQDVPAFLDGISDFAKRSDISIVDMKTQGFSEVVVPHSSQSSKVQRGSRKAEDETLTSQEQIERNLTLAAMPISIKVEGAYAAYIDFLAHLEAFEQLLTISNVRIAVNQKYPVLSCDFKLKIYSFKTLKDLERR